MNQNSAYFGKDCDVALKKYTLLLITSQGTARVGYENKTHKKSLNKELDESRQAGNVCGDSEVFSMK